MKKQSAFKTKGMNRDLSVSAFNSEFSFENINLRLNSVDGNNLLSWVNEKGTLELPVWEEVDGGVTDTSLSIPGICIGTAVLNQYLVLFVTQPAVSPNLSTDTIYRLQYVPNSSNTKEELMGVKLFEGHLNFDSQHPIDTLVSYEAENIQKVYWTDGLNQPRIINIMHTFSSPSQGIDSRFDFVRELQLQETVTVQKILGGNGMFAPGVIQYAFTYYDKYGQESSIFYTTPLYYISYKDRGAAPDDKVDNTFKITIKNVDRNFEYLRIYSIQRTSINGVPFCKRVQDIYIKDLAPVGGVYSASYIDTGLSGNTIDPTELLYKGGEEVALQTFEQKDGTLFVGNISLKRRFIESEMEAAIQRGMCEPSNPNISTIETYRRVFYPTLVSNGNNNYVYYSQLSSYKMETPSSTKPTISVPCNGFKYGNYYRLGIQFQYKTGKWSNPIILKFSSAFYDWYQDQVPAFNNGAVYSPVFRGVLSNVNNVIVNLINAGYRKVRPVVVLPTPSDRRVLCQGVVCPTLYTEKNRNTDKNVYAQPSWFFRTKDNSTSVSSGAAAPVVSGTLPYTHRDVSGNDVYNPSSPNIRQVEVWGDYDSNNQFKIDNEHFMTFHSPDIVFDTIVELSDFTGVHYEYMGAVSIDTTFSDIDIQTVTPTISSDGSGFVHKSFVKSNMLGIISGLFYDDYATDDGKNGDKLYKYKDENSPFKWVVNLWHKDGSLNNDIKRPSELGIQSAELKKKIISNLRFGNTTLTAVNVTQSREGYAFTDDPQVYSSNEQSITKINNKIYQGNINTVLIPDHADGNYFAYSGNSISSKNQQTDFESTAWWKTFNSDESTQDENGLWKWNGSNAWEKDNGLIGDNFLDLVIKKSMVRMKYKSSPHLICYFTFGQSTPNIWNYVGSNNIPIIDVIRNINLSTLYGGTSTDALRENVWVPCGEPVILSSSSSASIEWSYGDTYFQRFDCLKTYPFTPDDVNQVVEIGSFMLETYCNIDGRYDRNRGQVSNLNMNPGNFNLYNPIYSQVDNFFNYKVQDKYFYENTTYPNQISWSKTKESGASTDQWTNITLASAMELDGDKGKVNKLIRHNDQLLAFQDTGISQILYNENTQITTTDGVPIEIANSGKVQGKRYISNTVGCSNKWSVAATPSGIYFIDNHEKSIYLLNDKLGNVSSAGGFDSWCKKYIPSPEEEWYPINNFENFITYYDKQSQDVLFISKNKALAYSEKVQSFTSFYDYVNVPFFDNLSDTGVWTKNSNSSVSIWKHHAGDYCNFFGSNVPYSMTLVGNPEPLSDKTFTNLEFRATVDGEGSYSEPVIEDENIVTPAIYTPYIPFDKLETWNEYQHGITTLSIKNGHDSMIHHKVDDSTLKRKFRIWRCDIPRDNADISTDSNIPTPIQRFSSNPLHRMRNPWIYANLYKSEAASGETIPKVEIHDIVMTYYI